MVSANTKLLLLALYGFSLLVPSITVNAVNIDSRVGHQMVFDSVNGRVILFGGHIVEQSMTYLNDTWSYDPLENTWTLMQLDSSPSPRGGHMMAYSQDHEVIIMFGGMNTRGRLDETWIFDCKTEEWTQLGPEEKPQGRSDAALVYDSDEKVFVLYGGWGSRSGLQDDTWVFDPETIEWTEVETSTSPGRMYGQGMVYDSVNRRAILYGGHLRSPISREYIEDVWFFYSGNRSWIQTNYTVKPHGRYWNAIDLDKENMQLVIFGGGYGEGPLRETWVLDLYEKSWTNISSPANPPARIMPRMVYVQTIDAFICFGGADPRTINFNDTWILRLETESWEKLYPSYTVKIVEESDDSLAISGFPLVAIHLSLVTSFYIYNRKRGSKTIN
ncbi:MAG: hypothetical protein NWE89_12950 [Candidatus Bathyarchaeota archaeon]|nr:hypothetical protein [Candidatus Bathyarchaeota archaeon]